MSILIKLSIIIKVCDNTDEGRLYYSEAALSIGGSCLWNGELLKKIDE